MKSSIMKKLLFLLATGISFMASAGEIEKDLKSFKRIISSPRINVILEKGDDEHIRLVYENVSEDKINIEVRGNTLHLYLDNAKKLEKTVRHHERYNDRHSIYEGVTITAYVTYKSLEALEIRGRQQLVCNGPLEADRFQLRAYGENIISISSMKSDFFKASLYGENKMRIHHGKILEQRYRVYGENKVDASNVKCAYISTSIFGEGDMRLNSSEEVRVNSFGEPRISVGGGADINTILVFGKASITRN